MDQFTFVNNLAVGATFNGTSNPADGCSVTPRVNCACGVTGATNVLNSCFATYSLGGNSFTPNVDSWPGANCTTEALATNLLVNYNNGLGGDYHVKSTSVCHNKALDGLDPGADINTLNTRIQGVGTFFTGAPEDLLTWMSATYPGRTTGHMTGTGNPHYSWMDTDGVKFWLEKASTGHPWD